MALLLGGFMIHGLVPGKSMVTDNLDVTYSMVWSIAIANILGAGLCFAFSGQFAKIATLRYTLVIPAIISIMMVGAFVLPDTKVGITDASTTRKPSNPWTRN